MKDYTGAHPLTTGEKKRLPERSDEERMTFTIRYDKTGKEIVVPNSTGYIMMDYHKLAALGFKSSDVFEKETEEERRKVRKDER